MLVLVRSWDQARARVRVLCIGVFCKCVICDIYIIFRSYADGHVPSICCVQACYSRLYHQLGCEYSRVRVCVRSRVDEADDEYYLNRQALK